MDFYNSLIKAAMKNANIKSQRQLSIQLGLDPSAIHMIANGRARASEEVVRHLSIMAGQDPKVNVVTVREMKAKTEEEKNLWREIRNVLTAASILLIFSLALTGEGTAKGHNVNITTQSGADCILCILRRFIRSVVTVNKLLISLVNFLTRFKAVLVHIVLRCWFVPKLFQLCRAQYGTRSRLLRPHFAL